MTATPAYQERRLGRTILKTYRTTVDLYDVVPNDNQPRMGPKEDLELQRQIEANEGIFEPLLVEPHPELEGKLRIIDGDRRWTNSRILVEEEKKEQYRTLPIEITDRTLTEEERLRVWIYIHRQRKEWDAKEKEMVAYRLVTMVGRASAANILGVTIRELDKFVDVYELSEKLANMRDPAASITWARELRNINRSLMTPSVQDAIVRKINEGRITNSKDVRKLRTILRDPLAKAEFLTPTGTITSSLEKLAPKKRPGGLASDLDTLIDTIQSYPWTTLTELRGDTEILRQIERADRLINDLKKALKT